MDGRVNIMDVFAQVREELRHVSSVIRSRKRRNGGVRLGKRRNGGDRVVFVQLRLELRQLRIDVRKRRNRRRRNLEVVERGEEGRRRRGGVERLEGVEDVVF